MSRIARAVAVGVPHHVTQRGNNREDVFFTDGDRRMYLSLLTKLAAKHQLEVHAYCLMRNHVHLVVTPRAPDSLAKAVGGTHFHYSQYLNRRRRRCRHLWQGRFYSCALDERHSWTAVKYVEFNPVRAKLCRVPWRYAWSSAAAHVNEKIQSPLLDLSKWFRHVSADEWREQLAAGIDDEQLRELRSHTRSGWPLGSDRFLAKLEALLLRPVRPLPVGRPPEQSDERTRGRRNR